MISSRATKVITLKVLQETTEKIDIPDYHRPSIRKDCEVCDTCQRWRDGEIEEIDGILSCGHNLDEAVAHSRPCIYAACKYNLYLDVKDNHSLVYNFPEKEIEELIDSCVLDIANEVNLTTEDIASMMNISDARLDQIEKVAYDKLKTELGKGCDNTD